MFSRIVLGLFSGVVLVFSLIWCALQVFSRSQMGVVAAVILGIGLGVAGIVWWYTHSLAHRTITEAELQNGFVPFQVLPSL